MLSEQHSLLTYLNIDGERSEALRDLMRLGAFDPLSEKQFQDVLKEYIRVCRSSGKFCISGIDKFETRFVQQPKADHMTITLHIARTGNGEYENEWATAERVLNKLWVGQELKGGVGTYIYRCFNPEKIEHNGWGFQIAGVEFDINNKAKGYIAPGEVMKRLLPDA